MDNGKSQNEVAGAEQVLELLESRGIAYRLERHAAIFTMEDSRTLVLALEGARCKNLLVRDSKGRHFLIVTAADKSVDLVAAAASFNSKRLSFVSPANLLNLLGVQPGSLSPLALANDPAQTIELMIDDDLANESQFLFHPLDNAITVALERAGLDAFLTAIGHPPVWVTLPARVGH
ncbi:prolyl-tRNA synthetase associated domain-containing protein [Paraburkholderia sp. BCC1886]|uniref:prolyl-tRNA synthetase associated domain-containing protein n=1 Tax=Paraburkholderia sp. BCC1886 TaxID=2562670 RepID=UPI001181E113|nr:prolyl-tRNA synthetase associated domain-containing protein [Paraburkholderia sp. BCC1886]